MSPAHAPAPRWRRTGRARPVRQPLRPRRRRRPDGRAARRHACSPAGRDDGGRWRPVRHRRTAIRRVCWSTRRTAQGPAAVQTVAHIDAAEPEVAAGQHAGFVLANHLAVPAEILPRPQRPAPVDARELVAGFGRPVAAVVDAGKGVQQRADILGTAAAAPLQRARSTDTQHGPRLRFEPHPDERGPLRLAMAGESTDEDVATPRPEPAQPGTAAGAQRGSPPADGRQGRRSAVEDQAAGASRAPVAPLHRRVKLAALEGPTELAALEVQPPWRIGAHPDAQTQANRRPVEQPEIEAHAAVAALPKGHQVWLPGGQRVTRHGHLQAGRGRRRLAQCAVVGALPLQGILERGPSHRHAGRQGGRRKDERNGGEAEALHARARARRWATGLARAPRSFARTGRQASAKQTWCPTAGPDRPA
jgi:hypothetical protein